MTSSSQTLLPNTSTNDAQQIRDDQDEVIGRMDEDNDLPIDIVDPTVNKMDDDDNNSESPLAIEESTTKQDNDQPIDESSASLLSRVTSTSTMPITISRNIDIPAKNDTNISFSVMESSSLGRNFSLFFFCLNSLFTFLLGANSMSPLTASSVDKKKRNKCTWPSCNKKLGLTGKKSFQIKSEDFGLFFRL